MRKIAFTSLALASSMVFSQENPSAKDSLVISNKKELDSLKLEIQSLKEMVAASSADKKEEKKASKWYDKISVGGYVQVRYNEFLENNPDLAIAELNFEKEQDDSYAVAMKKDSKELKEAVDKTIQKLKDSGELDKLIEDAFKASIEK